MAAQPQPPQQPIYPNDLSTALDRFYVRAINFADGKLEAIAAQSRLYNQESMQRDQDLANALIALTQRVGNVERNQQAMAADIRELKGEIQGIKGEIQGIKGEIQGMKEQIGAIMQLIRDLHAEAMEAINDLRKKGNDG